jgi:hypothetical protein
VAVRWRGKTIIAVHLYSDEESQLVTRSGMLFDSAPL